MMNSVMTLNGLGMRGLAGFRARTHEEIRNLRLARENADLMLENTRLRSEYDDLMGSAETWIRLYEAALERAHAATAECSRLRSLTRD